MFLFRKYLNEISQNQNKQLSLNLASHDGTQSSRKLNNSLTAQPIDSLFLTALLCYDLKSTTVFCKFLFLLIFLFGFFLFFVILDFTSFGYIKIHFFFCFNFLWFMQTCNQLQHKQKRKTIQNTKIWHFHGIHFIAVTKR